MSVPDYAIGSRVWPGLAKLVEESGELQQVVGKLMAYPASPHPDGAGDLPGRLLDELSDVAVAIEYVVHANGLDHPTFFSRMREKVERFSRWHKEERGQ